MTSTMSWQPCSQMPGGFPCLEESGGLFLTASTPAGKASTLLLHQHLLSVSWTLRALSMHHLIGHTHGAVLASEPPQPEHNSVSLASHFTLQQCVACINQATTHTQGAQLSWHAHPACRKEGELGHPVLLVTAQVEETMQD